MTSFSWSLIPSLQHTGSWFWTLSNQLAPRAFTRWTFLAVLCIPLNPPMLAGYRCTLESDISKKRVLCHPRGQRLPYNVDFLNKVSFDIQPTNRQADITATGHCE